MGWNYSDLFIRMIAQKTNKELLLGKKSIGEKMLRDIGKGTKQRLFSRAQHPADC